MATLCVEHVSKRLGGVDVLTDVSFSADAGGVVGFVGPNGAGKTTTFRVIVGLLRPDEGRVLLDGRPLDAAARGRVAFCFDDDGVYDGLSAAENLRFFQRAYGSGADVDALLERVGLDPQSAKVVGTFSRGMRKRLGVARALLVPDPVVMLLDEPFIGLDPEGQDFLAGVVSEVAERCAVLLSSHDLRAVEDLCSSIVVLDRTVLYAGRPEGFGDAASGGGSLNERYLAERRRRTP